MKSLVPLIAFLLAGCASQPPEPPQELPDVQVFLEEPTIEYDNLGRVDETGRAGQPTEVLEQIIRRAAELGANGVIVHSIRNQGRAARSSDSFGTGGSSVSFVFRIQATAILYKEQ